MAFHVGSLVQVPARFSNTVTGVALDPTAVYFRFQTPAGVITLLHYGVDIALVKDSVGNYHVDISAAEIGTYKYRWYSTGTGQAVEEGSFEVKGSAIV